LNHLFGRVVHQTFVLFLLSSLAACVDASPAREPIVGMPCEGCELVFEGLPEKLGSNARIAPASEPGEPMTLRGRVLGPEGKPRGDVIVYAYQTDARGIYPSAATRHGKLRGWAQTDREGRYAFETIRPGSYPNSNNPAHIHMHVIERGCGTYYIEDVHFTDDPLLTAEARGMVSSGRGGSGIGTPVKKDGRWAIERDITLGLNVPGYSGCGEIRR
jgi:hypothetical protein